MPLLREIRKAIGSVFADPRQAEKMDKLKAEINYLYRYLGMNPGERQHAISLDDIRDDHLGRYEFACQHIKAGDKVIDAACGVGYGSYIIANTVGANVIGVDIAEAAISTANRFWKHEHNQFIQADCTKVDLPEASFDVAVSFETIEHIPYDKELLQHFNKLLKPGGLLICSTPNEDVFPFASLTHDFHIRHYTSNEIQTMIEEQGFKVREFWSQPNSKEKTIVPGKDGKFHIVIAEKVDA